MSSPPVRILVVDDEPGMLLTLVTNLEESGFEVEGVDDASAALDALRGRAFDLVLSDIRMPGMSGVELFGQVKQLQPDLPVVLMSGYEVSPQVEDAIGQGVYAVFPKPFDLEKAQVVLGRAARRPAVLVLVEGLPSSATTIASGLNATGVRADGVGDAAEALSAIEGGAVDVCVFDLGAPRAVPEETLGTFKAAAPDLAVIALQPSGGSPPAAAVARHLFAQVRRPLRFRELLLEIARARRAGVG